MYEHVLQEGWWWRCWTRLSAREVKPTWRHLFLPVDTSAVSVSCCLLGHVLRSCCVAPQRGPEVIYEDELFSAVRAMFPVTPPQVAALWQCQQLIRGGVMTLLPASRGPSGCVRVGEIACRPSLFTVSILVIDVVKHLIWFVVRGEVISVAASRVCHVDAGLNSRFLLEQQPGLLTCSWA